MDFCFRISAIKILPNYESSERRRKFFSYLFDFCVLFSLASLYVALQRMLVTVQLTKRSFYRIPFLVSAIKSILIHHWLWFKSNDLREYLQQITSFVSCRNQKSIESKYSRILAFLWFYLIAVNFLERFIIWHNLGSAAYFKVQFAFYNVSQPENAALTFAMLLFMVIRSCLYDRFNTSVLAYLYVLMTIQRVTLDIIEHDLMRCKDLRLMRVVWQKVASLRLLFYSFLYLLPFLWSIDIFVNCTAFVFRIQFGAYNSNPSFAVQLITFVTFLTRNLLVFSIVVINGYFNARIVKAMQRVVVRILGDVAFERDFERESLIRSLESKGLRLATCAWGMFIFEHKFLLGMLGNVVNYSVLFLQFVPP